MAKRLLRLSQCPGSRLSDECFLPIMGFRHPHSSAQLIFLILLPWFVGERGQDEVTASLAWPGRPFIKLPPCCMGHPNGRMCMG